MALGDLIKIEALKIVEDAFLKVLVSLGSPAIGVAAIAFSRVLNNVEAP